MTIVFKNSSQKIPKSGIFGPKFTDFFLPKILQLSKLVGVDFKHDNSLTAHHVHIS